MAGFLAGRFGLTVLYNIKLLYGTEAFPTVVRSRAQSWRIGIGVLSAIIPSFSINMLIYGALMALTVIIMYTLPETKGNDLPASWEDAEKFASQSTIQTYKFRKSVDETGETFDDDKMYTLAPPETIILPNDEARPPEKIVYDENFESRMI